MIFTVAIDGPAASGKGTIARQLAAEFGFAHLDTGLLYRAVGVLVAEGADPVAAARGLDQVALTRSDLRSEAAGQAASTVATNPAVRAELLEFQRRFARQTGGAVLDGRDIGTVVCPEAEVKLFVTATDQIRAERRWREETAKGVDIALDDILEDVRARDARDRDRATSPLVAAPDAVVLDTSQMTVEEAQTKAGAIVAARVSAQS